MKKKVYLCGLFLLLLCAGGIVFIQQSDARLVIEENEMNLLVKADDRLITVKSWFSEDQETYFFFLPSFIRGNRVLIEYTGSGDALVNGENKKILKWNENVQYKFETENKVYHVIFMKAQNLPSLFLDTDSGSMDYVHENKDNEEPGSLTVITKEGNVQYSGNLEKVSGRGNSTWHPYKKPYSIKLENKHPLCGMESGKKWKLLAMYFEQDKINTKIVFDMAQRLGLTATPDCRWVDLYCNGEYRGLYLLTEAVESDVSIQGSYLLEKKITEGENYFITQNCQYIFSVKEPEFLLDEEKEDLKSFVQRIEDLLLDGDMKYRDYIDLDSLASQFLINKIVMETDAMWTSTFFQVDLEDNILKAGPLWDYDRAFGELFTDYETPIEGKPNEMREWYMQLYEDEQFFDEMMEAYEKIIPYVQELLEYRIDEYVDMISHSVEMDSVLMKEYSWVNETCSYREYDSYIKYLKFFLASRMNYLNSIWGINDVIFEVPISSGEWHEVTFLNESGEAIKEVQILDGECVKEFPKAGLPEMPSIWFWWHGACGKEYESKMPVYEDTVLSCEFAKD